MKPLDWIRTLFGHWKKTIVDHYNMVGMAIETIITMRKINKASKEFLKDVKDENQEDTDKLQ